MSLLTNLSCYYKLDGDANATVGTNNGTGTNVTYPAGLINQGASFVGTGNISVADSTDFTFGSADFSVSIWVKFALPNVRYIFVGQINSTGVTASGSFTIQRMADNTIVGNAMTGSTSNLATSTVTITDSNWHHIVFLRDGTTTRIYIDTVASGTANVSTNSINDSSEIIGLGQGGNNTAFRLNGMVDEFGVWKRKLTTTEITQLYNSGNGLPYPFSTGGNSNFFMFM